jgi:hypothetical protein
MGAPSAPGLTARARPEARPEAHLGPPRGDRGLITLYRLVDGHLRGEAHPVQ